MPLVLRYHHPLAFFFFNDTATTEIYTLSLHDALPICHVPIRCAAVFKYDSEGSGPMGTNGDRKSTRLNSSHTVISYAVFCLKKKILGATADYVIGLPVDESRALLARLRDLATQPQYGY